MKEEKLGFSKQKVSESMAHEEATRWLNSRKFGRKRKEIVESDILPQIEDWLIDGVISIDDDNKVTHHLMYPIRGENGVMILDTLKFRDRLTVEQLHNAEKGLKDGDESGKRIAKISAMTGESGSIIKKMDYTDYEVAIVFANLL